MKLWPRKSSHYKTRIRKMQIGDLLEDPYAGYNKKSERIPSILSKKYNRLEKHYAKVIKTSEKGVFLDAGDCGYYISIKRADGRRVSKQNPNIDQSKRNILKIFQTFWRINDSLIIRKKLFNFTI